MRRPDRSPSPRRGTAFSPFSFSVTTTGPGIIDCGANPSALQPAIAAASPGKTLTIVGSCVGTFTISRDLTLKGPGATLDARGGGTTVTVSAGTVKLVDLSITGGGTDLAGGGIYNFGTLILTRSSVSGNSAQGGGGIVNNGTLTIDSSTVSGNSATVVFGGGIINNGALTLRASTVSGNTALANGGYGGGITNDPGGTITMMNSTVSGN